VSQAARDALMSRPYAAFDAAELNAELARYRHVKEHHMTWYAEQDAKPRPWWRVRLAEVETIEQAILAELRLRDAGPADDDPRLAQYSEERNEPERAIVKTVQGQYIGKPPPLLTGWAERTVAAVVSAGWLPPAAVAERIAAEGHCCDRPGG